MRFFSILLYDLAIWFYVLSIRIFSIVNSKAKLFIDGRKNWRNNISEKLQPNEKLIWFHCASVGEFEQARPVIEKLKLEKPDHKIAITFFSPSGYELRKNYSGADYVFYLPVDTKVNAQDFVAIIKPKVAVFVKYELWIHMIEELHEKKIPLLLISSVFRENQFFFKWYGKFFRLVLNRFNLILTQTQRSLDLLQLSEVSNVLLGSDTRFDRVDQIANHPLELPLIKSFCANKKILVAGSTWQNDEQLLIQLFSSILMNEWKLIVVPHEINQHQITVLQDKFGAVATLESKLAVESSDKSVLIIDSVGKLSSIYQFATVAYVGGGFGRGIHNILEPAAFGSPIIFGPNYKKFNEAFDLISLKGAISIHDFASLENAFSFFKSNPESKNICNNYVRQNLGGSEFAVNEILKLL